MNATQPLTLSAASRPLTFEIAAINEHGESVPTAIAGLVNPLIAALVMASSSLIVIGNALRAGRA